MQHEQPWELKEGVMEPARVCGGLQRGRRQLGCGIWKRITGLGVVAGEGRGQRPPWLFIHSIIRLSPKQQEPGDMGQVDPQLL
jgi:hypothetical protein